MPDPNNAAASHNRRNRANLIRSHIAARLEVDRQRAALNERMCGEREILREADISVKAVDEMARLKQLDREARDAHLDAWKEAFAAADLGYRGVLFSDANIVRIRAVRDAAE